MTKRYLEDNDGDGPINKTYKVDEDILVVHLRNLCPNISEKEIVHLAFPFGKISQLILLKAKNQAFIEFFDIEAAKNMLNFYSDPSHDTSLRGYKIYIQKSKHEHLDTSSIPPAAAAIAKSTIASMNALYDANSTQELPTNILRIKFEGDSSFINLDVIFQVFSKYGSVQKIITFNKNNSFQSFVQYPLAAMAQMARLNLCSMHLNGCLIAKIDFSKLHDLEVKQNNDKMRDYTLNPKLPDSINTMTTTPNMVKNGFSDVNNFIRIEQPPNVNNNNTLVSNLLGQGYTILPFSTTNTNQMASSIHQTLGGNIITSTNLRNIYGLPISIINPSQQSFLNSNNMKQPIIISLDSSAFSNNNNNNNNNNASLLNQTAFYVQPAATGSIGDSVGAAGGGIINFSQHLTSSSPVAVAISTNPSSIVTGNGVIIVSNFNEQKVTADALFILFGVYGDVLKVKILFNKRNTALIQMSNGTQAHLAINNLDNVKMYEKQIRVSLSKYQTIKMPKDPQGEVMLTKDYTNSPLHRYKKAGSKNYNNIFPPSAVLHLSNIPIETGEEAVLEIFNNAGFTIQKFKYFVNEKRMALVQMNDVEEAISALIELHNHPITNTHNLRISFSKSHF